MFNNDPLVYSLFVHYIHIITVAVILFFNPLINKKLLNINKKQTKLIYLLLFLVIALSSRLISFSISKMIQLL